MQSQRCLLLQPSTPLVLRSKILSLESESNYFKIRSALLCNALQEGQTSSFQGVFLGFFETCVFLFFPSLALRMEICMMELGVPSIRTGTSGSRWMPFISLCLLESFCKGETPSGGQVVSGLKLKIKIIC